MVDYRRALMLRDDKEQVAIMKRFRWLGVMLLAMFGLGVVMASSAQAEEAPYWSVGGTRLAAGKTHNTQARAFGAGSGALSIPAAGVVVTCSAGSLKEGVLLGSNAGEAGKGDGVGVFSSCSVSGNGSACTLPTNIVTNSLTSELVENVVGGVAGKKLLVLLLPAKGTQFVTLKFGGTCTTSETKVTGAVLAQVETESGIDVELPNTKTEATSWVLEALATEPAEVWLVKAGVGSAVDPEGLISFGDAAKEETTALTLLANAAGVAEFSNWSPLP